MLVTDAMSVTGTDLTRFDLHGRTIFRRDGKLTTEDGTLAGSDLDMAGAVRNAVSRLGVSLPDALRMASLNPATFPEARSRTGPHRARLPRQSRAAGR